MFSVNEDVRIVMREGMTRPNLNDCSGRIEPYTSKFCDASVKRLRAQPRVFPPKQVVEYFCNGKFCEEPASFARINKTR